MDMQPDIRPKTEREREREREREFIRNYSMKKKSGTIMSKVAVTGQRGLISLGSDPEDTPRR